MKILNPFTPNPLQRWLLIIALIVVALIYVWRSSASKGPQVPVQANNNQIQTHVDVNSHNSVTNNTVVGELKEPALAISWRALEKSASAITLNLSFTNDGSAVADGIVVYGRILEFAGLRRSTKDPFKTERWSRGRIALQPNEKIGFSREIPFTYLAGPGPIGHFNPVSNGNSDFIVFEVVAEYHKPGALKTYKQYSKFAVHSTEDVEIVESGPWGTVTVTGEERRASLCQCKLD